MILNDGSETDIWREDLHPPGKAGEPGPGPLPLGGRRVGTDGLPTLGANPRRCLEWLTEISAVTSLGPLQARTH